MGKSGFGSSSTAEQVVEGLDLSGKVAVVTGKSSQALSSIVAQGAHLNRLFCALHLIVAKDLAGIQLLDTRYKAASEQAFYYLPFCGELFSFKPPFMLCGWPADYLIASIKTVHYTSLFSC